MKKALYISLGTVTLVLGIIGIFVPLLPTTPFLLLTAWLYFRSSDRLYKWLINQKYLGEYIRNYIDNKAIPMRAKIVSLVLLWGTMTYCIIWVIDILAIKILLGVILLAVTYHIASFKTLRK